MHYISIGCKSAPTVIFAHGWGRSLEDFIPIAETLGASANSILIDLPGFGRSDRPKDTWSTTDYAMHIAEFIKKQKLKDVIFVGHSFGGRVALRLGAKYGHLFSGIVLVASSGVPRPRTFIETLKFYLNKRYFKILKFFAKNELQLSLLEERFGSIDYIESKKLGLRDIFVKTISENQESELHKIVTPVKLLYGKNDFETPIELGKIIANYIENSEFIECDNFDHLSILSRGKHQVALAIKELILEGKND
ncbi:alpha/beta fold hydrolase [Pseudoalteromonas piscicida]|uniref:alpha/beta fold hydrolase n=1 Tax=Pseudoalteromonas piscicida TaxID=43662 RepID=UPI000E35BE3F|nr:alpha/beta hydrolase [Pseudoalteromonas piscicida]AXQ99464.1 alpha/beta hydrolase [Pseudoalteromonas piscicida]